MSLREAEFAARAQLGDRQLSDDEILRLELDRARHALAYLKDKLGNDAVRDLLAEDVAQMTAQVRAWTRDSAGAWQSASMELVVPGPPAADFHRWYSELFARDRQQVLRAGHPEHFVNRSSGAGSAEVIENVGETELPWRISYEPVHDAELPVAWDPDHPVRFASQLRDPDGQLMGYTLHAGRDADDGMHLRMTTVLPAAAPQDIARRHLHHYAIEFRNWAQVAWRELGE